MRLVEAERVHGRVEGLLSQGAFQGNRRVQVGECRGRRRVGVVIGGHVDRLHGCDRAGICGGDTLLQLTHIGAQRRRVAHCARQASQQRRHLRTSLHEAEDIVDEEQDIAALIAEVLGHGHACQAHAQAGARRFVHLAEDHHRRVDHARITHFVPQVVALAAALAHTGKHRVAAVVLGDVVDQLLDDDRLAHTGAAEDAGLAALGEGGESDR